MELPTFEKLGDIIPIPIVHFNIVENKDLKAIASLDFGTFIIKGFRVSKSKFPDKDGQNGQGLWITPPSYRDGNGKYHPIFYTPDTALWEEIVTLIIVYYHDALTKHYGKKFGLTPSNQRS